MEKRPSSKIRETGSARSAQHSEGNATDRSSEDGDKGDDDASTEVGAESDDGASGDADGEKHRLHLDYGSAVRRCADWQTKRSANMEAFVRAAEGAAELRAVSVELARRVASLRAEHRSTLRAMRGPEADIVNLKLARETTLDRRDHLKQVVDKMVRPTARKELLEKEAILQQRLAFCANERHRLLHGRSGRNALGRGDSTEAAEFHGIAEQRTKETADRYREAWKDTGSRCVSLRKEIEDLQERVHEESLAQALLRQRETEVTAAWDRSKPPSLSKS